jgi:hypothetical protein
MHAGSPKIRRLTEAIKTGKDGKRNGGRCGNVRCGNPEPRMSQMGHSRPARTGTKPGQVPMPPKAEVNSRDCRTGLLLWRALANLKVVNGSIVEV